MRIKRHVKDVDVFLADDPGVGLSFDSAEQSVLPGGSIHFSDEQQKSMEDAKIQLMSRSLHDVVAEIQRERKKTGER